MITPPQAPDGGHPGHWYYALTPSAGQTGDQAPMRSAAGRACGGKVPREEGVLVLQGATFCCRVDPFLLPSEDGIRGNERRVVRVAAPVGEALIWRARRAAADSPSRHGAVFVLRVCKLAVIRLLNNDVGELIRAMLMGALISL